MKIPQKASGSPQDVIKDTVLFFFKQVESAQKGPSAPLVEETALNTLADLLQELDAPSEIHNMVADFIMKKIVDEKTYYYYNCPLRTLLFSVSIATGEQLAILFAKFGDVQALVEVTREKLLRHPKKEELVTMIEFHKVHSRSSDVVWMELKGLSLKHDLGATDLIRDALNGMIDDDIPI